MISIAPNGAALMKVTADGVSLIQGTNPSRSHWTSVLPLRISHADKVWQVTSVHSPDVIEGTVFYVIVCKSAGHFTAFTMMYNMILEHSVIVADSNGLPSSSGPISLIQGSSVVKYDSILYDESTARLVFEVTGGPPHFVPMGFSDFSAGNTVPTAVVGATSKTDIMYAYLKSGDVAVVYGDYDEVTGFCQMYEPNGNLGPLVEGRPTSQFGLQSPNCDPDDEFDTILVILQAGLVVQQIATAVPGDIQTIWTTTTGSSCVFKLSVLSLVGDAQQVTSFEVTEENPTAYVYTPGARTLYDTVTGAVLSTGPAPPFAPRSGVAVNGGHVTVATDLSDVNAPLMVYTVYNEAGVESGTASAALDSNNSWPRPSAKLVRTPYGYAFGSTNVLPNLTAMDDAGPNVGWSQKLSADESFEWSVTFGDIRVIRNGISQSTPTFPDNTTPYPGDPRVIHVIPQDDENTLIVFQRAPAAMSGQPQYKMSILYLSRTALDPTVAKELVTATTIRPNVADFYTYGGETFLVMSGNPLTNNQDVIAILKCSNWASASPTLTTYKEYTIPSGQAVESLRAEGASLVATFEPNEIGSIYTTLAYSITNLGSFSQNPYMDNVWIPVGGQSIPPAGQLVCQGIFCRAVYGQLASYGIFENTGLSNLAVTVGATVLTIPAGEVRVVHLQNVDRNFLTHDGTQVQPVASRVDDVINNVSLDVLGVPPSSTVGSVFFPSGAAFHTTAYTATRYTMFGRNTAPVSTLLTHNHTTDAFVEVSLAETVNAIVVKIPVPTMVVSGATFI